MYQLDSIMRLIFLGYE